MQHPESFSQCLERIRRLLMSTCLTMKYIPEMFFTVLGSERTYTFRVLLTLVTTLATQFKIYNKEAFLRHDVYLRVLSVCGDD